MIAIGRKPKLYFAARSNDMGHFYPSSWEVQGYSAYVTDDMYTKLLDFTDPELMKPPSEVEGSIGKLIAEMNGNGYQSRMERAMKLNPAGSMLWQFNGLQSLSGRRDYIRCVAAFGSGDLTTLTFADVYVKFPLYSFLAKALNKTLYFRRKREYAQWDAFVAKVHSKIEDIAK